MTNDYLERFRRCAHALERNPDDPEALTEMSHLCRLGGDLAAAAGCARAALRTNPDDARAARELDAALALRVSPEDALRCYGDAIAIENDLAAHAVIPGALTPFARIDEAQALLEQAVRLDPALAPAHAALGNLYCRRERYIEAIGAYRTAALLDAAPEVHLALSELLFDIGEIAASARFREMALARQQIYPPRPGPSERTAVLMLCAPGAWATNAPLDFVLNRENAALTRLYLNDAPVPALPAHDVIFNAIGEAQGAKQAIAAARGIAQTPGARVINRPDHLWKTGRANLHEALSGIDGCVVPRTERVSREEFAARAFEFPLLLRPIDSHAGRGLIRALNANEAAAYLEERDEAEFYAAPFVEYRCRDGYYRKYRVAVADGAPYPYHLAISTEWMIHYIKSDTAAHDWMRAEEEQFLAKPESVFPAWDALFRAIAAALGLDYFGIDCALLPNGRVLIFEIDTAMLIHCREPAGSYKYRYIPRIFAALAALIRGRKRASAE